MSKQDFSTYKVLRRHGGFYYCEHPEGGEIECKLKGSFKKAVEQRIWLSEITLNSIFSGQKFKALLLKSVNVIP